MTTPENPSITYALIAIVTAALTLLGTYLSKKSDNSSNIKIAEINADAKEKDQLKDDLRKALESIKNLKQELIVENQQRLKVEKKFDAVKIAYRIIFKQYANMFKDDPDSMSLLEELNHIINN